MVESVYWRVRDHLFLKRGMGATRRPRKPSRISKRVDLGIHTLGERECVIVSSFDDVMILTEACPFFHS